MLLLSRMCHAVIILHCVKTISSILPDCFIKCSFVIEAINEISFLIFSPSLFSRL